MLIRRTIDKPKEKLALFINYLKVCNISYNVDQPRKGMLEINHFYIDEDFLAHILHVKRPTIRNWRLAGKIMPIRNLHTSIDEAYRFNEILHGTKYNFDEMYNRKYRYFYYDIQSVYTFLWLEVDINDGGLRYPEDYYIDTEDSDLDSD